MFDFVSKSVNSLNTKSILDLDCVDSVWINHRIVYFVSGQEQGNTDSSQLDLIKKLQYLTDGYFSWIIGWIIMGR